ncbi:phosphatase PAP2 family protein [Rhizomonospora bruguierae]|uniref:phosphatase PAP2 family protein n=1 Tax=Rhizomonospora bruguierae TaxID=1581705 RepID=UPI001BCC9E03|nr:phosphatase PAP2 family protein [Micromonospora sp. NBRC 107566]
MGDRRGQAPGSPRRGLLLLAGGAAAAFALLTACVVAGLAPLYRADLALSAAAHRAALARPAWRSAMIVVTDSASRPYALVAGALLTLALAALRQYRRAAFVVVAALAAAGSRLLVLAAVARPRPVDRLAAAQGWSYPSGHTTTAASAALIVGLLLWRLPRSGRARRLLVAVAAAWALLVGVSRVALVVHWPTDVLGGWLLSLAVVPAVAALLLPTPARSAAVGDAPGGDEFDHDRHRDRLGGQQGHEDQ